MLAFYSDDLSSNPFEVYNFSEKVLLKRMKINKRGRGWSIYKNAFLHKNVNRQPLGTARRQDVHKSPVSVGLGPRDRVIVGRKIGDFLDLIAVGM